MNTRTTEFIERRGGKREGAGRPTKLKTQVKDFIKEYPTAVEELMVTLYELGIKGDIEAAKYVIDRIKGKPKSNIGIAEEDKDMVGAALYLEFCKRQDQKQLQGGEIVEGQIVTEGASQVTDAEDA